MEQIEVYPFQRIKETPGQRWLAKKRTAVEGFKKSYAKVDAPWGQLEPGREEPAADGSFNSLPHVLCYGASCPVG
jgi:hypothetical protein